MAEDLGLYLHFPFCVRKCRYCDFLSGEADVQTRQAYASAMIREIRSCAKAADVRTVTSIYLGGGTPSIMPARSLFQILRAVRETFPVASDAEITMEMNPGTLSGAILEFASASVNRVSLGMQSASDRELSYLGRIHTFRQTEESVRLLREAGIRNLSLDLMSGLPGQTMESFVKSLESAITLNPEHLSVYSLIIEAGTPFYDLYGDDTEEGQGRADAAGVLPLPDEDTERAMYVRTREVLERYGYHRYEISNYAKKGYASRHNTRYWRRGDYLGFGVGAASLYDNVRWKNTADIRTYLDVSGTGSRCVTELETLDRRAQIEEFMFLGLRMMDGIRADAFREAFGLEMEEVYGDVLKQHLAEGLLVKTADGYRLSDRGIDISNAVMADYLFD